jgi:hypothetical protein
MSALRVDDLDAWHEEMTADRVWFQTFSMSICPDHGRVTRARDAQGAL